jgi:hypothetical protein
MHQVHLIRPLPLQYSSDFPVVQYGDDTLIIMQADVHQIIFLKSLLHRFGQATGLKVNYAKSSLIPINISEERVRLFTTALQCQLGTLPFTYLGLPLRISALRSLERNSFFLCS